VKNRLEVFRMDCKRGGVGSQSVMMQAVASLRLLLETPAEHLPPLSAMIHFTQSGVSRVQGVRSLRGFSSTLVSQGNHRTLAAR